MNNKKIAFITCVNNDELYKECLRYIFNLNIPEGYEIETIDIREAKSMTSAYNAAMLSTDAKYKVYLHQDTFIVNKNFIYEILRIFNNNTKIGMIGVSGAAAIPTSAIWWEAIKKYGAVYESHTGKLELLSFNNILEDYKEVKAIDGLIMITQYDLNWREDIFDGWHFYDVSQCVEFYMNGYYVVVPKQDKVWCIHDCGMVNTKNGYEEYRKKFLDEYYTKIYPLVSILIPAYNQTKFLKEALESAINQTYPNIEIIIGDDSTTNEVEKFIVLYLEKYKNIKYFKNIKEEFDYGYKNVNQLFNKSSGEYINYLNHDDVFNIKKIEKMMDYFLCYDNAVFVTSAKKIIDDSGNEIQGYGAFTKVFHDNTIVAGEIMSKFSIQNLINVIGEPTTVLFKKKYLKKNEYGFFHGERIKAVSDLANWMNMLNYGDMIYLSEELSSFRVNKNQNSNKIDVKAESLIGWYKLIEKSYLTGLVNEVEYLEIIKKYNDNVLKVFFDTYGKSNNEIKDHNKLELLNIYEAVKLKINNSIKR